MPSEIMTFPVWALTVMYVIIGGIKFVIECHDDKGKIDLEPWFWRILSVPLLATLLAIIFWYTAKWLV